MFEWVTVGNLLTLMMLVFLQAVLGFDNLLYISIESRRVPADQQAKVRKLGIGLAIFLRIALLFIVIHAIDAFQEPIGSVAAGELLTATFNVHSLIVLAGGGFIIYTAFKEIFHLLSVRQVGDAVGDSKQRSVGAAVGWIVVMNLVFSFDSILSAIALTEVFAVMAIAIIISGVLMMVLADRVSSFLQNNRMYEVLGLFILMLVGIMLVSEGGHLAHIALAGHAVEPMAKSTFYFVLIVLVIVDVVQGRFQRQLDKVRSSELADSAES